MERTIILFLILHTGNFFAYASTVALGRGLSLESFGLFNAIIVTATIFTSPVGIIPYVVSRFTIISLKNDQVELIDFIRTFLFFTIKISILITIIFFLFTGKMLQYLKSDDVVLFLIMGATIIPTFVLPYFFGVLMGLNRYLEYSVLGSGFMLYKFILIAATVNVLNYGIRWALLAPLLAYLVSIALAIFLLRNILSQKVIEKTTVTAKKVIFQSVPLYAVMTMVMLLSSLDVVFVRIYCAPTDAGNYAVASTLAKFAFFIPSVFTAILYPETVRLHQVNRSSRKLFLEMIGLSVLLVLLWLMPTIVWSDDIIFAVFGGAYSVEEGLYGKIAVAMACVAIINLIVVRDLATLNYLTSKLLCLGLLAFVVGIIVFHDGPQEIANTLLLTMILTLLVMTLSYMMRRGEEASLI